MVVVFALITACLGVDQAYLHRPTAKEVNAVADSFADALVALEKKRVAATVRLEEARSIRIPSFQPRGSNARRERAELEQGKRMSIRRANDDMADAQNAMTEMRGALMPPATPIISAMSDTAPIGTVGALNKPARIVQVIDNHTLLISMGEDETLARLHRPTDGLTDDTSLKIDGREWFIVVGTYQYTTAIGGQRTVLDIKPFDVAPIRDEIQRRLNK